MTRFARAKGSKSSNEKKPEEATSWFELKNAMLLRNKKKTEAVKLPQKAHCSGTTKHIENNQEDVKWASLEDDKFNKSLSVIKQHLGKKRKINDLLHSEGKNNTEKKLKTKQSDSTKKKGKKVSGFECVEPKNTQKEIRKKCETGNKRHAGEIGGDVFKKKMRKTFEKDIMNSDNQGETEGSKKFQNMKKITKSNKLKVVKNGNLEFKNKNWKKYGKPNKKQKSKNQDTLVNEIIVNGETISIVKFQGFNVTLEDAERLRKLRRELIKEGVPKNKLEAAIKLERRRAEKALARLKKAVCFLCRGHGHLLSNCPNLKENEDTSTGICYKCGSTEHMAVECKVVRETTFQFAECFICKEQGHIARQCPDNPRGLYPNGGACRECGDVTHLRKDCPKVISEKAENEITVGVRNDRDLECLDEEIVSMQRKKKKVKKNSAVKF